VNPLKKAQIANILIGTRLGMYDTRKIKKQK
jgi:hypothetical protein